MNDAELKAGSPISPGVVRAERAIGASQLATFSIIGVIGIFSWHYLVGRQVWTAPALMAFVPVAIASGNRAAVHFTILSVLTFVVPRLFPSAPSLLAAKSAVMAAYIYILFWLPDFRKTINWWHWGKISKRTWLAAGVFMAGYGIFTWWYLGCFAPPKLAAIVPAGYSNAALLAYVIVAPALNALLEEIFWRGVMLQALDSIKSVAKLALVVQAVHFGIAHYRGPFFAGWAGVIGATILGVCMGLARRKTGGMFLPWAVHFLCDLVIFVVAAVLVRVHS